MIMLKKIIKIHKFLLGFSWGCCSSAAPIDEPPLILLLIKSFSLCRRFRNKFDVPLHRLAMTYRYSVISKVSLDTVLFLYVQGLQLLVAFAGENQNWQIRIKHLLPSSALVHRTSESNCCSVQRGSHRYLHFLQLLVSNVLAFSPSSLNIAIKA